MATTQLNNAFDTQRYILEEHILKGTFIEDQALLQSLNKMGGRIFNPVSFALNLKDDINDNTVTQLLGVTASNLLSEFPRGLAYTTDGRTFGRTLDSNIPSTFYTDAQQLKDDVGGGSSFIKNIQKTVTSKGAQAIGITKPYRSILGQALAFSGNDDNEVSSIGAVKFATGLGGEAHPIIYGESLTKRVGNLISSLIGADNDYTVYPAFEVEIPEELTNKNEFVFGFGLNAFRLSNVGLKVPNRNSQRHKNLSTSQIKEMLNREDRDFQNQSTIQLNNVNQFLNDNNSELIKYSTNSGTTNRLPTEEFTNSNNPLRKTDAFNSISVGNSYTAYVNMRKNNFNNNKLLADDKRLNDVVNNLDVQDSADLPEELANETLYMRITDLRNDRTIYLRPTMENLNEDMQTTFTQNIYLGRTESIPAYEITNRGLTFPLKLYAQSPSELLNMWKKIEFIKSLMYPMADSGFTSVKSPLVELSIGDIYRNLKGVINSVSTSIDLGTTTWEMEQGKVAPKVIDLTISYTVIHDSMPFVNITNGFDNGVFMHSINNPTQQ